MPGTANRLRTTRAIPPGQASGEGLRRETYGAALQQFDELMSAAAISGPVSRPLPLYYAVLQAGKAIAAAWSDGDPPIEGHGLAEGRPKKGAQGTPPEWHGDILRFRVRPHRGGPGVFGAVASTLGTARLTGSVELGALWSALPEVSPPPATHPWTLALPVHPQIHEAIVRQLQSPTFRGFVDVRGQVALDDEAGINRLLTRYPGAADAKAETSGGATQVHPTPWGSGVSVRWPRPDVHARYGQPAPPGLIEAHVHNRIPVYQRTGEHWLIPPVGEGQDQLPPVLLWWILLFGLSLLARYQPAAWRDALDLDRSPCADPLTALLDEALEIVPDLLYEATARA
jgi:hypothetical protein